MPTDSPNPSSSEPPLNREDILADMVSSAREELVRRKAVLPLTALQRECQHLPPRTELPFRTALAQPGIRIIAEIKKASPSTGPFPPTINISQRAHEYWKGGAAAISVVTEPRFFKGSLDIIRQIRPLVPLPILRKDFVVDAYQIYETRLAGADAVLLIASIVNDALLEDLIQLSDSISLDTVVEVTEVEEIEKAVRCGARIIGVNNRNLKNLSTDFHRSLVLASSIPPHILRISESGLSQESQLSELHQAGYNGFLIGDYLMRQSEPRIALQRFVSRS